MEDLHLQGHGAAELEEGSWPDTQEERTAGQRCGRGMVEKQAGTCRQSIRGLGKDGHKHYEAGVQMGLEQEGLWKGTRCPPRTPLPTTRSLL